MRRNFLRHTFHILLLTALAMLAAIFLPSATDAATLTIGPSSGTFIVGSTFSVSVFLDTQRESVNALDVILRFPPDKLQVVSPSTGQSIVGVWTSQPSFNNSSGEIRLQGGIPGGIVVDRGLITTLTFRARQVGQASLRFSGESRVLLNDGKGTDALRDTQGALYTIVLPPPAGPLVVSETHPDQTRWYANPTAILLWEPPAANVSAYSYILNNEPVDLPDDTPDADAVRNSVAYRNLADGRHYFHIKALRDGVWGGVTHFAINIDVTPPADFPIEIVPSARTTRRQPVIQWRTTDALSGIDRYELMLIPLSRSSRSAVTSDQSFFIETYSPYVPPELEPGTYDVIVRAYDHAGNYREVTKRLHIITAVFRFIGATGIEIRSGFVLPWIWLWGLGFLILAGLGWLAYRLKTRHARLAERLAAKEFPEHIKADLDELKKYREKYGKLITVLLLAGSLFLAGGVRPTSAQQIEFGPPIVTSVSRDISNKDIFYIGGKTDAANAAVFVYLQNLQTGETQRFEAASDIRGDWFYRHHGFLSPGNYLLWTQSKVGELISPPGPQTQMTVRQTALQFGATRISYEALYLASTLILLLALAGLVSYSIFHAAHIRRKEVLLMKEIKEAEEALRRGFAVLRRDIEAELAVVRKARLSRELAAEEKAKERELMADLEKIEAYIGKEIWDIEKVERGG